MIRQRIRIRFAKQDDLRWLSHRDLLRTWERLIRRAGLPLSMTEGFHPKPRMNFPSALAVGITGLDEVVELELCEERTAEELLEHLPP
jgi:radical SAM-linked protein